MNRIASCLALPALLAGCVAADPLDGATVKSEDGKDDASAVALFLDFEFEGEVLASSSFNPKKRVEDQLLYTIGQLNGDNSIGRLDRLELTDVTTENLEQGVRIRYSARLPVAWGDKNNVPDAYTLILPRDISYAGQQRFADAYARDCVDWGAHDVDAGSMWYYYRPARSGCRLDEGDVFRFEAAASVSEINTSGKFPEYHKVWEDDALEVVAIFGKYEDNATSGTDAGISAYNKFLRSIGDELRPHALVTEPAEVPGSPGVSLPEVTFRATMGDGRTVRVVAILVDNVRTAGAAFDTRYEELSGRADLIVYNGHAGLGANIRTLAQKGRWLQGQYAIVFMNGCDTYAYVDSALADAHSAVNPDDPNGTRYLDIVTNAMPSFFRSMPGATMSLVRGLMRLDDPLNYEQIFRDIDRSQVILVSGEQDNEFQPGGGGGDVVSDWQGLSASGTVARGAEERFETPVLAAGSYRFDLAGTRDADLYVRIGSAPSTSSFDCRPYKTGSAETCLIELTAPAPIHVMVRGWAASSDWTLSGVTE